MHSILRFVASAGLLGGLSVARETVAAPHCPAPANLAITTALDGSIGESVGPGMVRFHADERSRDEALPSFAIVAPLTAKGPAPDGWPVVPRFSTEGGRQVVKIAAEAGTSVYGTGEVAGPLLRDGRRIICWNTDAFGYGDDAPSLYKSHPWVFCVRADGTCFGVLADTTYRCEIDLRGVNTSGGEVVFRADGPAFPVIVVERRTPEELTIALAELTGKIEMPPLWALGYHQCRYSYYPEARVREIASEFRTRKIPCDVIWHDIDYMDGFRCFTWDRNYFPNPKKLNDDLHAQGFHTVWMIDPGIKAEKGYFVFDQGSAKDAWVKKPDGKTDYHGEVWPGMCAFPDFTRSDVRAWWSGLYKDFMATGVDGVWNDMNEPAVFNTPDKSKTMPEDNVHRADAALGGPGPHARFHNVYGMLMVEATREGILKTNPDKRPFVLSRASYLGGHRFGASWTGDNSADWYHLESSIPMVLNMGLSGQPFTGPDIGGFNGDGPAGEAGATMFARWMGIGTLLPFTRAHTMKGAIDKEPWAFGEKTEKTCREAIERRMMLLPYFYTLFHDAATIGLPVARPLFFADPADPALRSEDDAFLLGDRVMVVAQCVPDRTRVPVLPKGEWTKFTLPNDTRNADLPDMYLRAGAVVPVGPVRQFAMENNSGPLTLYAALDKDGKASGTLYEDSGEGFGYKSGEFLLTTYAVERRGDEVTVSATTTDGKMARPDRTVNYRVYLDGKVLTTSGRDGTTRSINISEAVAK